MIVARGCRTYLTSWQGVYRTASFYDMTPEDRQWLESLK